MDYMYDPMTNEHENMEPKRNDIKSRCVNLFLGLFFIIGCIWMLANIFAFSHTENSNDIIERDLSGEYNSSVEHVKSNALEGIYTIKPVYLIPETQVIAPKPNKKYFGKTENKSDLAAVAEKANEYGLIAPEELKFLTEDAPWSSESVAEYYVDKSIMTVTWKAKMGKKVVNFTEAVIGHPSQFRKYLTDNQFASEKRKTVSSMSKELNAVVGMSADYYAYRHIGVVIQGRKIYRDNLSILDNCFVDENGNLLLVKSGGIRRKDLLQYVEDNKIVFSLSFGPILVKDGEIVKQSKKEEEYILGQVFDFYSRAAIGQLGELHYLLCTVDGGATSMGEHRYGTTVPDLAAIMKDMGCSQAYTLDGGQTATMTVNGKVFNQVGYGSERPVSDIIYFATAMPEGN